MAFYILKLLGKNMDFIIEFTYKLIFFVWNIAKIIFPLMIALEILRDLKLLDQLVRLFKPMLISLPLIPR